MTFPTPWSVEYWAKTPAGPDPHRNPSTFTPALTQAGQVVAVYGWYVPSTDEPNQPGHPERVIADVVLMAPPTFAPTPGSVIGLPAGPAGRFEVVGYTRDYSHGPFGFAPGNVVALKRVEG